jgi:hypothetical protein
MQPEGHGAPRRRRIRPSLTPRGRQLLKVPIADWEVGLLDDMVRTEFDLRVMSAFGRPPTLFTHGQTRFVLIGGDLYDVAQIRDIYQRQSAELEAILDLQDLEDPSDPTATHTPCPPPATPQEALQRAEYRVFWPLYRDAALAEVDAAHPSVVDLQNFGSRLAVLAPDLFMTHPEPQAIPLAVFEQLIADDLLAHHSTDPRRRMIVVQATPDSRHQVGKRVLPGWEPARRKSSAGGPRRGRKT